MRLKLPSEGQPGEQFHKATFPKKALSKYDQIERSAKEITELSVKATLFDEGTLKNLLKEKSSLSQLEQSLAGEEPDDDDDDFVVPKKTAIFKSKRLQNKKKRKDIEKDYKEQKQESLRNDEDKEVEEKREIEGLYTVVQDNNIQALKYRLAVCLSKCPVCFRLGRTF